MQNYFPELKAEEKRERTLGSALHILESHMPDSQEYKDPDKCNPHFLRLPFSLTLQDYLNVFFKVTISDE